MTLSAPTAEYDVAAAYADHDRQIALRRIRIGCVLAVVLLPLGAVVDQQVYPDLWLTRLLHIRIAGAMLMLPLWAAVQTAWGQQNHRFFCVALALVPAGTMAVLIHQIGDAGSPYYAGLNLVLLTIGLLLQWTAAQSLIAVSLVVAIYLGVCALVPAKLPGAAFNNLYFLVVTGLIVVIGNSIASRLRFREFAAQHRLRLSQQDIERANAELEASYERLRELDLAKSRFFANISHELRTPLTLLLGPLDALAQRQGRVGEEEVRGHLGTMQANGLRLLKLINDLLDLERLDSGRLAVRPEPVEVPQFLGGLVNSARQLAEDRRIQLRLEVEGSLGRAMLDPDKLEKVLLNLLINAIKFTAGGGTITCRAERRADQLVVSVSDSGVGIQSDDLPHIFDRFWQADTSSQRKHQGAGIGLALVKELVEALEGHVTVESEVDRGTTFTLTLPWIDPPRAVAALGSAQVPSGAAQPFIVEDAQLLTSQPADSLGGSLAPPAAPPAAATNAEPPAEPRDAWLVNLYRRAELFPGLPSLKESLRPDELSASDGRPRVLIADDEPDMLRFLRSQLSGQFQVFEAVDGQQAIEKAAQFLPDIILSDMMMPEKDGLDVCREVRARFPTRNIPIVLLTARADDETKLAALAAGASDFLSKPFSTTELRVRLKNLVDAHRLQKELAWQNQKLQSTLEQLKETESQLVQSEKMASLGRMSAGIIHEINNPLNYAKTGIFTLQKMGRLMPPGEIADFEDILHDIGDGLTRVAGIVGDLRAFTHPHGGAMEDVDVRAVADGALRFLAAETKEVAVDNAIPPGFRVRANRNKLIQVFVNLLQNAVDALGEKRFSDGETARIVLGAEATDTARTVTLRDNGPGMGTDILDKIFDPFFTTKEVGKGTGLGLSICYRIINEAGGRITARSEPGKWTEFALEFPTTVSQR